MRIADKLVILIYKLAFSEYVHKDQYFVKSEMAGSLIVSFIIIYALKLNNNCKVLSAIMGFIFAPLLVTLGYVQLIRWNHFNTFLIIAFVGFLAKGVTSLVISFEDQYQAKQQNLHTSARLQPAMKPLEEDDKSE